MRPFSSQEMASVCWGFEPPNLGDPLQRTCWRSTFREFSSLNTHTRMNCINYMTSPSWVLLRIVEFLVFSAESVARCSWKSWGHLLRLFCSKLVTGIADLETWGSLAFALGLALVLARARARSRSGFARSPFCSRWSSCARAHALTWSRSCSLSLLLHSRCSPTSWRLSANTDTANHSDCVVQWDSAHSYFDSNFIGVDCMSGKLPSFSSEKSSDRLDITTHDEKRCMLMVILVTDVKDIPDLVSGSYSASTLWQWGR